MMQEENDNEMMVETNSIGDFSPNTLRDSTQSELPISEISNFPLLERCYKLWLDMHVDGKLPRALDPDILPEDVLPYTMLLDHWAHLNDAHVRFVGNYVGERAIFSATGNTVRGFFSERDADVVYSSMKRIADSQKASLARRTYVRIAGLDLNYVRLILPLSDDGETVTGFFKTIEPDSLREADPS